jgi:hypothetical protein
MMHAGEHDPPDPISWYLGWSDAAEGRPAFLSPEVDDQASYKSGYSIGCEYRDLQTMRSRMNLECLAAMVVAFILGGAAGFVLAGILHQGRD